MIKVRGKIWLLIVMLIFSMQYSCERVEPDDFTGTGGELVSVLNPDVKKLDTRDFNYVGMIDQNYIFMVLNNTDLPSVGDIVYYSDGQNQLFGRVEEISSEATVLRLGISDVSLDNVFNYLALECDLSKEPVSQFIYPSATVESDSLFFDPIELLWNFGGGKWALINLDSLKIHNQPEGIQSFYMSPVWESGVKTQRINLEYNHQYHLEAQLKVISKGIFSGQDSIMIRERSIGPFYADSLPVYYIIREWLEIQVETEGDNSYEAVINTGGESRNKAGYQMNKSWNVLSETVSPEDGPNDVIWDKKHSFKFNLCLKTMFIPVFCGLPGMEFSSFNEWDIEAILEWPGWDYSLNKNCRSDLVSDNRFFSDIPAGEISSTNPARLLAEGSGQLENQAPVPLFAVNPPSGFTDTNFTFNASNSYDFEDSPEKLEVRWDFNGDEVWDTNYSTDKVRSRIFSAPGNYTVVLEVRDSQGLTARLAKVVNVLAISSAPTAFFVVTPESGRTSDIFSFDASGSWDSEDIVGKLKVRWDFDGDEVWDTEFSTVKAAIHTYRVANTYVAKLEVQDTQGLTGSTSRIIVVEEANIKPTAIFTVNPEEGDINTDFIFDASESSDVEDDVSLLRVRWDFENDGVWDTEYRTIKTINHNFELANTYTVLLEVIDTDDFTNTYSRSLVVKNPNTAPRADFTISPPTGDTTTLFTFDARISEDAEDGLEELLFRWDWDNNDIYDTEFSSSPIIQKTFNEIGTFIIKLQVKDSGGLTHTKARLIIVE